MNDSKMTPKELKATWGLGAVFTLRMLGMFMVLSILTSYGRELKDANELLLGLAIGIYGITQAICQIPFGLMSDRFGRKQLITASLLIFISGSVIAAITDSIWGIIIGRALQGAGVISAAIMALLSDMTSEQICISILFISELTFCFSNQQFWLIVLGLQLFFIAFNVMEALLPSLISKEAPAGYKGTAMGLYSTSQFLGIGLGGILGGWLFHLNGASWVFMASLILCSGWFFISLNMHQPTYTSSIRLVLPQQIKDFNLLHTQLMN